MKSILVIPSFERCIDDEALAAYFTLSYVPAPLTIFRGIRKLPAGHTLTVGSKGSRQRQYWDISFRPDTRKSEAEFIEEFKQRMQTAVGLRLISDVPLGAFLSGGIDSSAVVAFMAQATSDPVNTFTIGFGGGANSDEDERAYARLVADRYRTNHRELEVLPRVDGLIESIVRSFDEPFADDSTVPSYYVCKMARENVTVALSGLGGDEAFAGYERYLGFRLSRPFHGLPASARSLVGLSVERLPESRSNRVNHLKRFVRSASLDDAQRYLGFVTKIGSAYRDQLFAQRSGLRDAALTAVRDRFLGLFRDANAEDPLDKVFYCDVKTYLTDDILALTDRISMAHSLEVRVPFLDHELFEFTATIPAPLKLKWFRKKYLLKKALKDMLPRPVLSHKKRGFVGPLPTWLREDAELKAYALRVLAPSRLARHDLFDQPTVTRILSDHFEGRETNDTLIWALIIFQTWFEMYIEKDVIETETTAVR
jgi:asparagine synthase (glutamine-hydrolysing)